MIRGRLFFAAALPTLLMPAGTRGPLQEAPPQAPMRFEMRELTSAEADALPPGDGRDAVALMCVPCHGVLVAIGVRKTPPAWEATVERMLERGAKGTDEQAQAAAAYLGRHFPAVDVNTGTAEELVAIAGLTPGDAAAIIAYREKGNAIKSYTELRKVPGVDPKRLAAAKARIVYTPK